MGRSKLSHTPVAGPNLPESEEKVPQAGYPDGQQDPVDASNTYLYDSDGESISSGQDGVKKAQATTIVWTRNALIIAYAL